MTCTRPARRPTPAQAPCWRPGPQRWTSWCWHAPSVDDGGRSRMAFDDRERWEARYGRNTFEPERNPSEFLVAHAHLLHGRVLDVAAGSGRNALFLARCGLSVDAIDIAFGGLQRLRRAALAEGLSVRALQADL